MLLRRLRCPRPARLAEPRPSIQPNLTGVTVLAGERLLPSFHGDQITAFIPSQEVKIMDEDSPAGGFAFHLAALSAPSSRDGAVSQPGVRLNRKANAPAAVPLPELFAVNAQTPR